MQTITIDAPALYGDHHVTEVRRILLEIPGVKDVYASSSFLVIEVTFDPKAVNEKEITSLLEAAGYLGELPVLTETGIAAPRNNDNDSQFRHTTVYETTQQTVSFARPVSYQGRPLWPCPGMGVIEKVEKNKGEVKNA